MLNPLELSKIEHLRVHIESYHPYVLMVVGVPASGKSTIVNTFIHHVKTHHGEHSERIPYHASTDLFIEKVAEKNGTTYNDEFLNTIKLATKTVEEEIANYAIASNTNIIWDQTNLSEKSRKYKLNTIPDHYTKFALYVPTPPTVEWTKRLNSRVGKNIPSNVLASMITQLEPPTIEEGFKDVINWCVGEYE